MIEAEIIQLLAEDAPVVAIASTRVYPLALPQNTTLPAITYQRISGIHEHTLSEPSTLTRPRFQFVAHASTFLQARQLANAIKTAFNGRRAARLSTTIQAITVENEFDHYNPAQPDMAASYSSYLDLVFWHTI